MTIATKVIVLLFGFGVSGGFGVVSIFFLELRALVWFWYKGCFRHLHTES
jgi:hypothetical protein